MVFRDRRANPYRRLAYDWLGLHDRTGQPVAPSGLPWRDAEHSVSPLGRGFLEGTLPFTYRDWGRDDYYMQYAGGTYYAGYEPWVDRDRRPQEEAAPPPTDTGMPVQMTEAPAQEELNWWERPGADMHGAEPSGPKPLGPLTFWGPDQLSPALREWGAWLRDLLSSGETPAMPLDFDSDAEAVSEDGEGDLFRALQAIRSSLGLSEADVGDEEYDPTRRWQSFLSSIPSADFNTQRMLASLRYDPETSWYVTDVSQLQNPRYM